jgi:probable HAF family extracellular repeat protein
VNDNGIVVGYTSTVGNEVLRAFKWTAAGGMVNLGTVNGNDSYATSINNDGLIVGNDYTADGQGLQGFTWTGSTGMVSLGGGGRTYSQIGKVTGESRVLGFSYDAGGAGHATVWSPGTTTSIMTVPSRPRTVSR